jgi:undecaprenyl-diphosphatase
VDGRAEALARTHAWFDRHSGWAPPDADTLAEWLADGVCRSPDECLVAPDGCCEHGLVSWAIVVDELEAFDRGGVSMRAVTSAADPPTSEPIVHDVPDQERIVGQDFIGEAIHQRLTEAGQAHPRIEELPVVAHVGAHDVPPPHDLTPVERFDQAVDRAFDRLRGTEPADRIFYAITELGDFGLIWLLLGTSRAALSERQLPNAVRIGTVLPIESVLVNGVIKSLFKRERPVVEAERPYKLRVPLTTSFPSGHSSSAAVAAVLLSQNSRIKPVWWVLAGLVASSRVYVRIHHASDVVGGLAVGLVIGTVAKKAWPLDKGPIGTRRYRRRRAAR